MRVTESHIIELPKIADKRGNLSTIGSCREVPFVVRRVHWIYDVPGGFERGQHAYKQTQEFIVALSGSFDVELDDGQEKRIYSLNRSYRGVFVPQGLWRRMFNFSTNSVALVLSSTPYDDADYMFDYDEFCRWAAIHNQ